MKIYDSCNAQELNGFFSPVSIYDAEQSMVKNFFTSMGRICDRAISTSEQRASFYASGDKAYSVVDENWSGVTRIVVSVVSVLLIIPLMIKAAYRHFVVNPFLQKSMEEATSVYDVMTREQKEKVTEELTAWCPIPEAGEGTPSQKQDIVTYLSAHQIEGAKKKLFGLEEPKTDNPLTKYAAFETATKAWDKVLENADESYTQTLRGMTPYSKSARDKAIPEQEGFDIFS